MGQGVIALDSHTSAHPCESAFEQMRLSFGLRFDAEDKARLQEPIYELAGCPKEDLFFFTSSSAEAIAQVIWSVFSEKSRKEGKTQWIASCMEDAPTLQMLKRCEELGCSAKMAPLDKQGMIDLAGLEEMITPRTALISVTAAHGLTGVIQPFEKICEIAHAKGVLVHLEASYLLGQTSFAFGESRADYLTFSGERIHSVSSSGGLFVKKGTPLTPFIPGASLDFPSLAALSSAAKLSLCSLDSVGLETARLRDLLESLICQSIPDARVLFQNELRLPNTSVIEFPRAHADALEYFLKRKGLFSNHSGDYFQYLHRILEACGLPTESALSFSLNRMTTEEEIIRAASVIKETVSMLRHISQGVFEWKA